MADISTLLGSIRERDSRSGILTADRYFREVQGCFDGGHCPINGADDPEQWAKQLAECEQKLTYTNSRTRVLKNSIQKSPEEGILVFDAIITTPHRDRDGDVLLTKGADLDMDMPLLWQHIAMQPIGKLIKVMNHTDEQLVGRFVIADTALGRDAAKLIRCGALRISHGFMPSEMEPMEDENGWLIKQFHIFETSVVSIPSNIQARITSISAKKFNTPVVRGWLKSFQSECKCKSHAVEPPAEDVKSAEFDGTDESANVEPIAETVEPVVRTLTDVESEFLAKLSLADTAVVRKSQQRISTLLASREREDSIREFNQALGICD